MPFRQRRVGLLGDWPVGIDNFYRSYGTSLSLSLSLSLPLFLSLKT